MSTYSGVISYSDNSGNNTNRCLAFGENIVGKDSFYAFAGRDIGAGFDYRKTPWVGIVETGEEQVAEEGAKSNVMEVWLRTYVSGTTAPDAYIEYRGTKDSSWSRTGDDDATISVTELACTGTGCAWSNTIAAGDDATTVFALPCLVDKASIYIGSTPQALTTNYTKSGEKEITLLSPLLSGTTLYAYWTGTPFIKMRVGDIIETSWGWHRVTAIPTYNTLTLADYLQVPDIVAGEHHQAQQLPIGEGETIFGVNRVLNTMQLRITIVPRYISTAATNCRLLSYKIGVVSSGERQKKA
jgi:hypothetical protein